MNAEKNDQKELKDLEELFVEMISSLGAGERGATTMRLKCEALQGGSSSSVIAKVRSGSDLNAHAKILPALHVCQRRALSDEEKFEHAELRAVGAKHRLLIVDDVAELGYERLPRDALFDERSLAAGVAALARFHATSFVLQRRNPDVYAEFAAMLATDSDEDLNDDRLRKSLIDQLSPMLSGEEAALFEAFVGDGKPLTVQGYMRAQARPWHSVIVHGAPVPRSVAFRRQNGRPVGAVLLDWERMTIASPVSDLICMLFLCTDHALRARLVPATLDRYYAVLASNMRKMGVEPEASFPRAAYELHLRKMMPIGLFAALGGVVVGSPSLPPADSGANLADRVEHLRGVIRTFIDFKYM